MKTIFLFAVMGMLSACASAPRKFSGVCAHPLIEMPQPVHEAELLGSNPTRLRLESGTELYLDGGVCVLVSKPAEPAVEAK